MRGQINANIYISVPFIAKKTKIMQITLRPYQEKMVSDIRNFFLKGGKSAIVTSPTGSGKTVVFSYISAFAAKKQNKVLIFTDRGELLLQTGGSLKNFNQNPFYIQAGCKFVNQEQNVFVAMTKTLKNRIDKNIWKQWFDSISLIIIDECHKQDFNWLFEDEYLKDKLVLGFTATPARSGKMRQLALDYEEIITSVTVPELIELGFLVNDDYYGIHSPDSTKLGYSYLKGDFDEKQMFQQYDQPKLYQGVVENWQKTAKYTQTLCFCVNIQHVIKTTLEFRKVGFDARFITSGINEPKLKPDPTKAQISIYEQKSKLFELYKSNIEVCSGERTQLFNDFATKKFPILVNAGIATTGYDNPSIETVIVNRATMSQTLWMQMIGRGSRIFNGKTHFNILDFGGNAERLGHFTSPRFWSLWHKEAKGGGIPPVKFCGYDSNQKPIKAEKKGCKRMILAVYKICPFCGFIYPEKKKQSFVELDQIIFDGHTAVRTKKIKDMNVDELYKYRELKKHKMSWFWRQLYYRGGVDGIIKFGRKSHWSSSTVERAISFCKSF